MNERDERGAFAILEGILERRVVRHVRATTVTKSDGAGGVKNEENKRYKRVDRTGVY